MEWGVYKWMMQRARGHEIGTRSDTLTRQMRKKWVAQWGITKKARRCGGGEREVQDKVLERGEREEAEGGHTVMCSAGTPRAQWDGTRYKGEVVRCTCG